MTKVIPHQKPKREPKPYTPPKPKRYAVEKRVRPWKGEDDPRWTVKEDYRFASNAKRWARYWEEHYSNFEWRVVDRKGTL